MRHNDPRICASPHQTSRQSPETPTAITRAVGAFFLAVALSSCSGPSRKQYAQLLGECRAANREHLRLVQEYDKRTSECVTVRIGDYDWEPKVRAVAREGATSVCPPLQHPEQAQGSAEMGLGGF